MTESGIPGPPARPERHGAARAVAPPAQRPVRPAAHAYRPTEVVSADELESIHVASLRILAEIGMDFLDPESRELLAAAGADVEPDGERVRFDPDAGDRADHARAHRSSSCTRGTRTTRSRSAVTTWRSDRSAARRTSSGSTACAARATGTSFRRPAEAVPDVQLHPLRRRLSGRADRPALVGPPPRGGARRAHAHRQGAAQLQPRPPAQPRRHRDVTDRPAGRRGDARARAVGVHRRQLVVAAAPRHPRCCRASSSSRPATRSS